VFYLPIYVIATQQFEMLATELQNRQVSSAMDVWNMKESNKPHSSKKGLSFLAPSEPAHALDLEILLFAQNQNLLLAVIAR
jgi:hypothetical protein